MSEIGLYSNQGRRYCQSAVNMGLVNIVRNIASQTIYGRYWDAYSDGRQRETPQWCCGLLMLVILTGTFLTLVGTAVTSLDPAQRILLEKITDLETRWEGRRLSPKTEESLKQWHNISSFVKEAVKEETPNPFIVKMVEGRLAAMEEITRVEDDATETMQIASEAIKLLRKAWILALKDGKIDQKERALFSAYFSLFPDEIYENMPEESKFGTMNDLFKLNDLLNETVQTNEKNKDAYEQERRNLFEDEEIDRIMGLDTFWETFLEYNRIHVGLPSFVACLGGTLIFGLEGICLSVLIMHILAHWNLVQYVWVVTPDVVSYQPSLVTWWEFVGSLFLYKGLSHIPYYLLFVLSCYYAPITRPFYLVIQNFAKNRRQSAFWGPWYRIMENRKPMFMLALLPCIVNVQTNLFILGYLAVVDELRVGQQFLGYRLAEIEEVAALKCAQIWSYGIRILVLIIVLALFFYIASACQKVEFMLRENKGTAKRLREKYTALKFVFPILNWLYQWRGWVSWAGMIGMSGLQYLEYMLPAYVDVADGGLPTLVIEIIKPFAEMGMYLSEAQKTTILESFSW